MSGGSRATAKIRYESRVEFMRHRHANTNASRTPSNSKLLLKVTRARRLGRRDSKQVSNRLKCGWGRPLRGRCKLKRQEKENRLTRCTTTTRYGRVGVIYLHVPGVVEGRRGDSGDAARSHFTKHASTMRIGFHRMQESDLQRGLKPSRVHPGKEQRPTNRPSKRRTVPQTRRHGRWWPKFL